MAEREKVIDGIERLRFFNQRAGRELWGDKPAEIQNHDIADADSILADALALLREQEARVMTREEVIDLLQGSVVWFEEHSESGDYLRAMISSGTGFLGDFYLGVNAREVDYKRNRFWTSRPTEEQRKAVPWKPPKEEDDG